WREVVAGGSGLAQGVEDVGGRGGVQDVEAGPGGVGCSLGSGGAVGVDMPGGAGRPWADQQSGDGQAGADSEDRGQGGGDRALGGVPVGCVGAEEVCEVGCGGGDGGFVAGCPGSAGGQCGGQHSAGRVVCAGAGQADAQGGQVGQPQGPAGLYTERRCGDGGG